MILGYSRRLITGVITSLAASAVIWVLGQLIPDPAIACYQFGEWLDSHPPVVGIMSLYMMFDLVVRESVSDSRFSPPSPIFLLLKYGYRGIRWCLTDQQQVAYQESIIRPSVPQLQIPEPRDMLLEQFEELERSMMPVTPPIECPTDTMSGVF